MSRRTLVSSSACAPFARVVLAGTLVAFGSASVEAQATGADASAVLDDGRPLPIAPAVIARNDRGVTVGATRITAPMTIPVVDDD